MPREKKHTVKPMEKKGKSDKGKDVEIIGSKRKLKVKYTVETMEKKEKSEKGKDVEKIGSKRKLKVKQKTKDSTTKRIKLETQSCGARTEIAKPNAGRVTQPKYVQVGQPLDECLEEDTFFNEWVEKNLPSRHQKAKGVHWISVERRNSNEVYETKTMPDIIGLHSAFDHVDGTKIVNTQTLKKLAKKYSFTSGKWMLFGKTGQEIDQLWRTVADGVIKGIIPSVSAKVSASNEENDSHVICIYNDNFLNESEVYALRDGIWNSGIDKPLKYKADMYTCLGIYSQNTWGIDPVLYREEKGQCDDILFNLLYDKQPSISAVAGITLTKESSPLLSIAGPTMNSAVPITLGIKSISNLEKYGNDDEKVRLSILFHDGNICLKGIAFGASARKWKEILNVKCTYKIRSYAIKESNRKYTNTKYEIHLWETTVFKKLKNGYTKIPREKKMKISELDQQFENLLVSTSKVMITEIEQLIRPKEKFLREIYINDATGEIKIKMWSHDADKFPYNEGEFVKLKYVSLRYDSFCRQCYLEKSDNMIILRCNE
ncbi:uncharacterized protein LOC127710499 isoform X3 [Mytilus californianus]|uniref:uncharacterized protein LOC127710499 isoform X3 n=1 Tax=Mytilus californianus TaxID=6549 RepID=UPI0022483FBF|nr:uncharacterized protein LOC127710499 isoform X3 [Mytilus californianus]